MELDKQVFNILAGIYNPDTTDTLAKPLSSCATSFTSDITLQGDIDAAYEMISIKTKLSMYNAGIGYSGLIDWIRIESMRKVMNVNVFGYVAMTKTFLPFLITKQDSRVVNICSVAGYLSTPEMASYCCSKYALKSFSDCLCREMESFIVEY